MNIRTEPFKAEHMKAISDSIIEQTFTAEEWCQWAEYNEATSTALTAFVGDKIMACGGLRLETNTMWVVIDKCAAQHKKEMLYAAKVFIKICSESADVDKINCQVCVGFEEGHRFVKHLGFEPLGTQDYVGFEDYELDIERVAA